MTEPARRLLAPTDHLPGMAALSSTRHAYGVLTTAMARLANPPTSWTPEEVAEAVATLAAARELVEGVGQALSRAV